MKVKAVNRKPVSRPKGTLALQGGEEVSCVGEGAAEATPPSTEVQAQVLVGAPER